MKKVMLALGVATLMGATWYAAGQYYSNQNQVEEVSYRFAQYELDESPFLVELSQSKQTSLMGTAKGYVKAVINPVRAYFSSEEEMTFNDAKIIKVGGCSYASNSSSTDSSSYAAPSTSTERSTFSFDDNDLAEPSYLYSQSTTRKKGGYFLFKRSIQH